MRLWVATGSFNRMVPSLTHYLIQQWCRNNFPTFINNENWPPHSSDLNLLDHSILDELVNAINWNKVKSKTALIQQIKLEHKKFVNQLFLKAVSVGPIDCIACIKMMENVDVNKNNTIL